ncbi:hypothetical protein D3C85_1735610 [compost metagenome]
MHGLPDLLLGVGLELRLALWAGDALGQYRLVLRIPGSHFGVQRDFVGDAHDAPLVARHFG